MNFGMIVSQVRSGELSISAQADVGVLREAQAQADNGQLDRLISESSDSFIDILADGPKDICPSWTDEELMDGLRN